MNCPADERGLQREHKNTKATTHPEVDRRRGINGIYLGSFKDHAIYLFRDGRTLMERTRTTQAIRLNGQQVAARNGSKQRGHDLECPPRDLKPASLVPSTVTSIFETWTKAGSPLQAILCWRASYFDHIPGCCGGT